MTIPEYNKLMTYQGYLKKLGLFKMRLDDVFEYVQLMSMFLDAVQKGQVKIHLLEQEERKFTEVEFLPAK